MALEIERVKIQNNTTKASLANVTNTKETQDKGGQTEPGLVIFYDIQPVNGLGQFFHHKTHIGPGSHMGLATATKTWLLLFHSKTKLNLDYHNNKIQR